MQDYFYDQTMTWSNKGIDSMFMLSHLVTIVDANRFDTPVDKTTSRSITLLTVDILYHPGDLVGIAGLFLNNTNLGIVAHLVALDDSSIKYFSFSCTKKSTIFITC